MKEIQLTQGYVAWVDDADFERVKQFNWYAQVDKNRNGSGCRVYASRHILMINGKQTKQKMHRFILGVTDSEVEVDHEDHNGLNNQRKNLRKATKSNNQHNTCKRINNTSGYKGVCWHKTADKWVAQIRINGRHKYLGLFSTKEEAAAAYDAAALEHFGEFAGTNVMLGLLPPLNIAT